GPPHGHPQRAAGPVAPAVSLWPESPWGPGNRITDSGMHEPKEKRPDLLLPRLPMVIEWNAHIFSPDRERYPFHRQAAYRPDTSGQPADPLQAYLDRMAEAGIDRAVIVQPEPY